MHVELRQRPEGVYLFDQIDILAHLFFAAGTSDQVRVSWIGGSLTGTFAYPNGERALVLHSAEVAGPAPGVFVTVEYDGTQERYHFVSEVTHSRAGELGLHFPESIECSDRRITLRVALDETTPVRLRLGYGGQVFTCRPVNLSDAGIGFLANPMLPFSVGTEFDAMLDLDPSTRIVMRAEVRHCNPLGDEKMVGARFTSMSLRDRAVLARHLWADLRTVPEYSD